MLNLTIPGRHTDIGAQVRVPTGLELGHTNFTWSGLEISLVEGSMQETKITRLYLRTVKQFCQENPAFSEGSMRWLLFNRESSGLDQAVVKVGSRVLIDVDKFYLWLTKQNEC